MNLNDLLDETARKYPKRTALILSGLEAGIAAISFSELRQKVLQAACAFKEQGLKSGDAVAIVQRNGLGFIVGYLGLLRLGAVSVPINFMVQKEGELRFMLEHCEAKGVLTQQEFLKGVLAATRGLNVQPKLWISDADPAQQLPNQVEDFWAFVSRQAPDEEKLEAKVSATDVASILYTSGTTGVPKGVMLTHANLVTNCDASIQALALSDRDVFLCILPMFHTFAWTACVLIPLRLGCKNVVVPSITPAKPWLTLMGRHKVTTFAAVPQLYSALARQARGLKGLVLRYWYFRSVRLCISGAAPLGGTIAAQFQSALGKQIMEGYGLTETSPVATINRPKQNRAGSVGLPIEGVELRILCEEGPWQPGWEGEILIRGPNVMKGYYKNPQATQEALTPEGWLKTGDIGTLDEEGYLYIRDRKKDMIIVKGLKVFSAQVEAVLMSHPDVEEAALIGVPDETGDEMIKAFVVLKKEASPDKSQLLEFCREKLDPYKRPRDIEIVSQLPKNALQKVLKRELRERELQKRQRPR